MFPGQFASGENETEVMMFGAVAYALKEGKGEAVAGWAGHAQLRRAGKGESWRLGFYRVYIQR